jgi:4a-hydroxytetrahydrobiopterin dehydratase
MTAQAVAGTPEDAMPTLLDDRLVADALTALTGWSGDAKKITRTVALDGAAADALLAEVALTAAALNHHPGMERSGGAIVFGLSTHSEGGVTEYDIALASRIDDLISKVTGGGAGTIVGAPTDAGSSSGRRLIGGGHREDGSTDSGYDVPGTNGPGEDLEPPADESGPGDHS